jgi:hypothetical protein
VGQPETDAPAMTSPQYPVTPESLEQERERVITLLSRHFANDGITLDDLETRLELAYQASSVAEVRALAAGLAPLDGATGTVAVHPAPAPSQLTRSRVLAIMSSVARRGVWVPPQTLQVDAVMAEARVDLRQAQLSSGVMEIPVRALMASVVIITPPGVHVVTEVTTFMADVSDRTEHGATPPPVGAPVIRITGWACMAGVSIKTRRVDE